MQEPSRDRDDFRRRRERRFFDLDDARPTPIPANSFNLPTLGADPRDTPQDIRFKIQVFERRVRRAEGTLADVRRRIERAERLQNAQRLSGDFAGGIERFGDTQVRPGPRARVSRFQVGRMTPAVG